MVRPTLSTLERSRIAAAAKLAAAGAKIHWRVIFPELSYTVDGKRPKDTDGGLIFTQGGRRVYELLREQAEGEFYAETQRLAEARGTSKEAEEGRGEARAVAFREVPPMGGELPVHPDAAA